MKCNLKCPFAAKKEMSDHGIVFCCSGCHKSKKIYVSKTPRLQQYWSEKDGFASENGCRLPRRDVPKDCKEYDCHDWEHTCRLTWDGEQWTSDLHSKKVR